MPSKRPAARLRIHVAAGHDRLCVCVGSGPAQEKVSDAIDADRVIALRRPRQQHFRARMSSFDKAARFTPLPGIAPICAISAWRCHKRCSLTWLAALRASLSRLFPVC